ncbi:hypothetical protein DMC25_06390 [Caulobacter sp. D4A]|uniref:hypothetical protein n=1 Tax=unclassified Caulobacter TaxID=2648921 RepID=UPI000D73A216|nr:MULTISPECIES: hypothetical protein [unclassified Caulobacter]PXA91178.1 hypothetical protein DMC25_06390 [Caulobacter sp. D4A]PXA96801.1 hypothetical protein DMC18_00630 [Caulobacter sp. D5]
MITFVDLRQVGPEQSVAWVSDLAGRLRPSDLDEIAATHDLDPEVSLTTSVMLSDHAWVILKGTRPIAVFGCAATGCEGSGLVWMMGTPEMDERRAAMTIARATRPYLRQMHRTYPCLWNYIDARNDKSMNWLRWSGFRLLEAHPKHGREGRLFFTFARYDPHV